MRKYESKLACETGNLILGMKLKLIHLYHYSEKNSEDTITDILSKSFLL